MQQRNFNSLINEKYVGVIIIVLHIVGVVGYQIPALYDLFIFLTPFNLLITTGALLYFIKNQALVNWLLIGLIFLIGFFAEFLGVNYQILFGDYSYGPVLGWKLWNVPVMIGVNWVLLTLSISATVNKIVNNNIVRVILGAAAMVLLDFLIEPVAIQHNYWTWGSDIIPISNYVGWFFVSLITHTISLKIEANKIETIGVMICTSQVLFFTILNLF